MRKYRFPDRATAELAHAKAERERLRAEWFASALIQGNTVIVGEAADGYRVVFVGVFATRHSAFVFAYTDEPNTPHCIRGIWEVDEVGPLVAEYIRHTDSHDLALLYDAARQRALKLLEVAAA